MERIGHRPLTELTSSEVRVGLDGLTGRLSTRTLTIARQSLERTVRFAMNHDRVARNVVTPVEVPKGKAARKSKSLDLAQAQALLAAAEASRWYGYIAVSLLSGLRTEEVRALRWEHVHLDDEPEAVPHIDVWRAERAGGDVKTPRSRRSLRLPALCVDALRKQQERQEQDRRIAGERWQEYGLVFASAVGTPLLSGSGPPSGPWAVPRFQAGGLAALGWAASASVLLAPSVAPGSSSASSRNGGKATARRWLRSMCSPTENGRF